MSQQRHLEYEKRFQLSDEQFEKLKALGDVSGPITNIDELWDTPHFNLGDNEKCLRTRNGVWELKVALPGHNEEIACREEIYDESKIAQIITDDETCTNLKEALIRLGVVSMGKAIGKREEMQLGELNITFTNTTYEDTPVAVEPYNNIVELEVVLEDETQGNPAEIIREFADKHGLGWGKVKGKFANMVKVIRKAKKECAKCQE